MRYFGKLRGDMNKTVTRGGQKRMSVIIERDHHNFIELTVTDEGDHTVVQLFIEREGWVYEAEIENDNA
jgi:hypothetical protein